MGIFSTIQNKKKQAEYAKWADKFPLNDDCTSMEDLIKKAEAELVVQTNEFYAIKGIKVAKKAKAKRERDALRDYINDMKNYLKDLQCGVAVIAPAAPAYTTNTQIASSLNQLSNDAASAPVYAVPVQTTTGTVALAAVQPVAVTTTDAKVVPDAPIPVLPATNGTAPIKDVDKAIADGKTDSKAMNKKYLMYAGAAIAVLGIGYLVFHKK